MSQKTMIRWVCAALLLCVAAFAQADECNSFNKVIAQPTVLPNFAAGSVVNNGTALGVIKNSTDGSNGMRFALFDYNLNQITPDRVVATSALDRGQSLLWNGTEFGLFYRNTGGQLVFQRISAQGEAVGGPVRATGTHSSWPLQEYDFVWDATRKLYLILTSIPQGFDSGIWLIGVDAQGTVQLDQLISNFFVQKYEKPRLAVLPYGVVGLTWSQSGSPGARTNVFSVINANNVYSNVTQLGTSVDTIRLAQNGFYFAAVWSTAKQGGGTELHWARMTPAGVVFSAERLLLQGKGVDVSPVSLQWNPDRSEWALTYLDAILGFNVFPAEYRLRRFAADGTFIADELFSADATRNLLQSPYPFAWTGRAYVGGIERLISAAEGSDSYLVYHCPLVAAVHASNRYPSPGQNVTFTADASGGVGQRTYRWDFGDGSTTNASTSPTAQHIFVFGGSYTVTLTVMDANQSTTVTTFRVGAGETCTKPPTNLAIILSADRNPAQYGETITFRGSISQLISDSFAPDPNESSLIWDFGDGSPTVETAGVTSTVTHVYRTPGTYLVKATGIVGPCVVTNPFPPLTVKIVAPKRRSAAK